jgi:transglutaminase-like putative cysteine protease
VGDFAPSAAAAAAANPTTPIVTRKHPSGAQGARISLKEVCHRILEGRLDPRIRAWTIQTLQKAGRPRSHRDRAQAILDELRRKVMYVPDPTQAEVIQSARLTLCLDDKGFCFAGGDCDDEVVAFGSCCMSVGIPVRVVGQIFDGTNTPTHVIAGVQVESGDWLRVDPSSERWPVGQCSPATSEVWLDPFDEDDKTSGLAGGATTGDYVGVGAPPMRVERHWHHGALGWRYEDRPVGLGQGVVHAAVTNAATWIEYGALGTALGVAGYVLYRLVR